MGAMFSLKMFLAHEKRNVIQPQLISFTAAFFV